MTVGLLAFWQQLILFSSSVPAEVKSNREMKVTDTVVSFFLRWLRWLVCPSPGSIFPGCFVHGLHWDSMIAVGLLWDYGLRYDFMICEGM